MNRRTAFKALAAAAPLGLFASRTNAAPPPPKSHSVVMAVAPSDEHSDWNAVCIVNPPGVTPLHVQPRLSTSYLWGGNGFEGFDVYSVLHNEGDLGHIHLPVPAGSKLAEMEITTAQGHRIVVGPKAHAAERDHAEGMGRSPTVYHDAQGRHQQDPHPDRHSPFVITYRQPEPS